MTFCQESYPLEMKSDQWENRELTEEKLTVLVLLTKKCCWNDCYDIVSFLTLLPGPFSVIMSREIFTALILPNSLLWSFFFFLNSVSSISSTSKPLFNPSMWQHFPEYSPNTFQDTSMHRNLCSENSRVVYYPFPPHIQSEHPILLQCPETPYTRWV